MLQAEILKLGKLSRSPGYGGYCIKYKQQQVIVKLLYQIQASGHGDVDIGGQWKEYLESNKWSKGRGNAKHELTTPQAKILKLGKLSRSPGYGGYCIKHKQWLVMGTGNPRVFPGWPWPQPIKTLTLSVGWGIPWVRVRVCWGFKGQSVSWRVIVDYGY